jgi:hypothetical protein
MKKSGASLTAMCVAWVLVSCVFRQVYHAILAVTNQTTWEAFRSQHITYLKGVPKGSLPFSRGACKNLRTFFFPPPDRLLRWRVLPQPSDSSRAHAWCANCFRYGCMPF